MAIRENWDRAYFLWWWGPNIAEIGQDDIADRDFQRAAKLLRWGVWHKFTWVWPFNERSNEGLLNNYHGCRTLLPHYDRSAHLAMSIAFNLPIPERTRCRFVPGKEDIGVTYYLETLRKHVDQALLNENTSWAGVEEQRTPAAWKKHCTTLAQYYLPFDPCYLDAVRGLMLSVAVGAQGTQDHREMFLAELKDFYRWGGEFASLLDTPKPENVDAYRILEYAFKHLDGVIDFFKAGKSPPGEEGWSHFADDIVAYMQAASASVANIGAGVSRKATE